VGGKGPDRATALPARVTSSRGHRARASNSESSDTRLPWAGHGRGVSKEPTTCEVGGGAGVVAAHCWGGVLRAPPPL